MTTEQSTTELATWLDGRLSGDLSLELPQDPEVLCAVWAMRPDLAPPANLSIELILSRVSEGPFAEGVDGVSLDDEDFGELERGDGVGNVEDDFVSALFGEARKGKSTSSSVSLEDVLARIESGPFGPSVEGVLESTQNVESIAQVEDVEQAGDAARASVSPPPTVIGTEHVSANNNRWWNARWLAGGLAAALVLLTLIPSEFETPVSEDSIFAPQEDMPLEEPLPAEEVEAIQRVVEPTAPKKSKATVNKPKKPTGALKKDRAPSKEQTLETLSQQPPPQETAKRTDQTEVSDLLAVPSDAVNQSITTKSMSGAPTVRSGVVGGVTTSDADQDLGLGTVEVDELTEAKTLEDGASIGVASTMKLPDTTTDKAPSFAERELDAFENVVKQEPMPVSQKEEAEDEEAKDMEEESVVEDQTVVVPQVDQVLSTERMETLTVSKESKRRQWGKAKGGRAKKASMAPAESAPMAMSADDAVSGYSDTPTEDAVIERLPTVLSLTQVQQLASLTTVQQVLALCDDNKPTEALNILWVAHKSRILSEQIQLLETSNLYSTGDPRYLKRNWLTLAGLYRRSGNISQAELYEQRASNLP